MSLDFNNTNNEKWCDFLCFLGIKVFERESPRGKKKMEKKSEDTEAEREV